MAIRAFFVVLFASVGLSGATAAGKVDLAKSQSLIKGLLIREVGASSFAGVASQMNATAVGGSEGPAKLTFNQDVGKEMQEALQEVEKFLSVKHGGWPQNRKIEIAFEEKYGPKDGPSAAVACALLIDSLITGSEIDPGFAVTGDMNADGSVQPVGGVPDKIRGAAARECQIVAIPAKCVSQIKDTVILEGPGTLYQTQIVAVSRFDEAREWSAKTKPDRLSAAQEKFASVQQVLQRAPNAAAMLRNPHVISRLREIAQSAPQHLSAQLLLEHGLGRFPRKLSLLGSLSEIDRSGDSLVKAVRTERPDALSPDEVARVISALDKLRPLLDARTMRYADALSNLGKEIRTIKNQPPRSRPEILKAQQRIKSRAGVLSAEIERLSSDKALNEELMR